jgi:hypothetical protein
MNNQIPIGALVRMGDKLIRLFFIRDDNNNYAEVYCSTCKRTSRIRIKNILFEQMRCDKCNHLIYNELEK